MTASARVRPILNALAVFEVVCREGSLTAAARHLNIAQSAVSRHVAQLERRIGRPLLERHGNRLTVTDEGRDLAAATARGLAEIDRVIRDLRPPRDDVFIIGCSPDVAEAWLMPRFHRLLHTLGARQLRLLTSVDYALFDAPDVDLSLRHGVPERWPHCDVRLLFGSEWFPVAAPALIARHAGAVDSEDFARLPLLHLGLDQRAAGGWQAWLGLDHDLPGPAFTGHGPMLHAALAGEGVALAWAGFVEDHLAAGRLVRLGRRRDRTNSGLYLVAKTPLRPITALVMSDLHA